MTIALIISVLLSVAYWILAESRIRRLKAELADMTEERDVQACKVWGLNQDLRGLVGARDDGYTRAEIAEADADRLAPFVKNFIADMDAIAKKLGTIDNKPLDLTDEREAIRLHEEAVKLRTK